jgi:hypothetical protein
MKPAKFVWHFSDFSTILYHFSKIQLKLRKVKESIFTEVPGKFGSFTYMPLHLTTRSLSPKLSQVCPRRRRWGRCRWCGAEDGQQMNRGSDRTHPGLIGGGGVDWGGSNERWWRDRGGALGSPRTPAREVAVLGNKRLGRLGGVLGKRLEGSTGDRS